jgi:hypothetical protein
LKITGGLIKCGKGKTAVVLWRVSDCESGKNRDFFEGITKVSGKFVFKKVYFNAILTRRRFWIRGEHGFGSKFEKWMALVCKMAWLNI